jgi:hypothetical protein
MHSSRPRFQVRFPGCPCRCPYHDVGSSDGRTSVRCSGHASQVSPKQVPRKTPARSARSVLHPSRSADGHPPVVATAPGEGKGLSVRPGQSIIITHRHEHRHRHRHRHRHKHNYTTTQLHSYTPLRPPLPGPLPPLTSPPPTQPIPARVSQNRASPSDAGGPRSPCLRGVSSNLEPEVDSQAGGRGSRRGARAQVRTFPSHCGGHTLARDVARVWRPRSLGRRGVHGEEVAGAFPTCGGEAGGGLGFGIYYW